MKNKAITIILALMTSLFLFAGCGTSEQDAETIAGLQAKVDELQNQVEEYSALKTELDSANNSIAELQSQIDALNTEKEEMSAKLEMLYKIEPLDETVYYTTSEAKVYDDLYGEILGMEPVGTIPAEQEVNIIGKSVVTDWYRVEWGDGVVYIAGSLLGDQAPPSNQSPTSTPSTTNSSGSSDQLTPQDIQNIIDSLGGPSNTVIDPNGGNGWNWS